jgi:hypothetical protein
MIEASKALKDRVRAVAEDEISKAPAPRLEEMAADTAHPFSDIAANELRRRTPAQLDAAIMQRAANHAETQAAAEALSGVKHDADKPNAWLVMGAFAGALRSLPHQAASTPLDDALTEARNAKSTDDQVAWLRIAARSALDVPGVAEAVIRVGEQGAKKYSEDNWLSLKNGYVRCRGAAYRHWTAMLLEGADAVNADDFSLPHIGHLTWSLLAAITFYNNGDRP